MSLFLHHSSMSSIQVQGSFELPTVEGVNEDASQQYKIACAQVLPSENGVNGKGGLDKLESYAKEAASKGADGEHHGG
jgi:hypothetical protein